MPFFSYKARNSSGQLFQGALEGVDSGAVALQLMSTGLTPVEIAPAGRISRSIDGKQIWDKLTQKKVTPMDVQLFTRQLYTLLKAGVPIMRGLAGLQESAINKSFAKVLLDLRESLDAGRELSAAMARHPTVFSAFFLSMVRMGEMTGRLEDVFLGLFDHLEFDRDMKERIKTATRYPTFVVMAMVVAMIIVNIFVIPSFTKVFASFHAELPLMTRILVGTSNFTVEYWPLLIAAAAVAALAIKISLGSKLGRMRWDSMKLHIPIAGKIIMKGTMARFARSFAMASKSGVPIVQGLNVVSQTVDNAYLSSRITQMRDGVERGETILRTSSAAGVFTPIVLQMIAVGEEAGALGELMEEIAQMYEREVDYELKTLSAQIEPILIVFMGGLVLALALGIFLPIWNMGQISLHR